MITSACIRNQIVLSSVSVLQENTNYSQGRMQSIPGPCESSDFPDFVDNFFDFSPIFLPYFPILW